MFNISFRTLSEKYILYEDTGHKLSNFLAMHSISHVFLNVESLREKKKNYTHLKYCLKAPETRTCELKLIEDQVIKGENPWTRFLFMYN